MADLCQPLANDCRNGPRGMERAQVFGRLPAFLSRFLLVLKNVPEQSSRSFQIRFTPMRRRWIGSVFGTYLAVLKRTKVAVCLGHELEIARISGGDGWFTERHRFGNG